MSRTSTLAEARLAIDHAWAQLEPAVNLALHEVDALSDSAPVADAAALVALGLLSRLAGFALHHITGLHGLADLANLAEVEAEDALWTIESIANLRHAEVAECSPPCLTLGRRPS